VLFSLRGGAAKKLLRLLAFSGNVQLGSRFSKKRLGLFREKLKRGGEVWLRKKKRNRPGLSSGGGYPAPTIHWVWKGDLIFSS